MEKGIIGQQQPSSQVNPKLQEEADIFVANGIKVIHDQKVSDNLIKQIQGSNDPIEGIADATLSVIERLEQSASQNGIQISDAAKIHGSNQLMGEVINIAEIAGVPKLNEEQRYQAFSLAVSKYIGNAVNSGKISKEQLMQMGQEAQATPEGQKIAEKMGANNAMPAQNIGGMQNG